MDDVQSISRKSRVDKDFLSDLPLSIIHCILSLVPIRDAVRTCIMSRQWRYKWATLPRLVFDHNCVDLDDAISDDIFRERLKNFITNALFVHKGPIRSVLFRNIPPDFDHCLLWLSRKNEIRELVLEFRSSYGSWFRVHSSLYSCQKLTRLELLKCELCPPPLTGFSCLRSLVLRYVKVSFDAVESLVANSPLLESFTYVSFGSLSSAEFRISAPNLKYIELSYDFEEISLYAPLLAHLYVTLAGAGFTIQLSKSSVCNYTKFLGGFTNLESFRGHGHFMKYLSIGIEAYDHSLVFNHLMKITIDRVGFNDIKEALVVVRLIMGAPNLQKLILNTCPEFRKDALEASPISLLDFGSTPDFTFNKLRVIEMSGVRCHPYEMEFIKFLLRSSTVLETMTLDFNSYQVLHVEIMNLMNELLSCNRASPNAKILHVRRG